MMILGIGKFLRLLFNTSYFFFPFKCREDDFKSFCFIHDVSVE